MKKYKAITRFNGVQGQFFVYANSRQEALKLVWTMTDAEDVYLEEVTEDGSGKEL